MAASLSQIVLAIFVLSFVGVLLVAGFVIVGKLPQWKESARKQLSKNHIDLLPDGRAKFGVENISHEEYMDRMQKAFVGAVNNSHTNLPSKRSTIPRCVERYVVALRYTYDWLTTRQLEKKPKIEK